MKTLIAKKIKERLPGGSLYDDMHKLSQFRNDSTIVRDWYKFYHDRYWYGTSNRKKSIIEVAPTEMGGVMIPVIKREEVALFWYEFCDLLFPLWIKEKEGRFEFDGYVNLFEEGPYELNEHVCIDDGDVVIDCGANIGIFSAVAAKEGANVYAFEPSKYIRDNYTQKTAKMNGRISVIPYALGDYTGKAVFELNTNEVSQSKIKKNGIEGKNTETVDITTLDEFVQRNDIKKIDFIKADIEGAERDMLRGAENVLRTMSPKLSICTYHLEDDKEVLESIIREYNKDYVIEHKYKKMYCYCM